MYIDISIIITAICTGMPENFKTELLSRCVNILTNTALKIFNDQKFKKRIQKSLDAYKENIIEKYSEGSIENDLNSMFKSKEFVELCKNCRINSGYQYLDIILLGFKEVLEKHGINYNIEDELVECFTDALIEEIKNSDEELYKKINESLIYKETIKKIKREYKTINDYDLYLKENTKLSNGIDFFKIDDLMFIDQFKNKLKDESIYVSCQNFEECTYMILNWLREDRQENRVRIIESIDGWNKLKDTNKSGIIYIPFFHSDRICEIKNNTCIFIVEDQLVPFLGCQTLKLERRLNNNIINALVKTEKYDYEAAHKLVIDNHGLFKPIFHELLNGKDIYRPKWYGNLDNDLGCICAMIGQWVNCEGDKKLISELFGGGYNEFEKRIHEMINGADPLFLEYRDGNTNKYVLTSKDILYDSIKIDFNSDIWNRFDKICLEQVNKYYVDNKISEELFIGILNFINYFVNVKNVYEIKVVSENMVKELLNKVTNKDDWEKVSEDLILLAEIYPSEIINKINDALDKGEDFIVLFKEPKQDYLKINAYIKIIFVLESLLIQKEFCREAFRLLIRIYGISQSNNLKDVIVKVLFLGYNYSAINTVEEKKEAAKYLIEHCDDGWDILFEQITLYHGGMVINISKPKYREVEEQTAPSVEEINKLYQTYFDILLDNAKSDVKRIAKFLERHITLIDVNLDRIKSIVNNIIENFSDDDKLEIDLEIRKYIHDNRMYKDANWSIGENIINGWENILNKIKYSKKEYSYLYLFLLTDIQVNKNPIEYNEPDWLNRNIEESKKIIENELKCFKENELSIESLIEKLSKVNHKTYCVGSNICKYYTNKEYNKDILNILYNVNNQWASEYIGNVNPYNKDVMKMIVNSDNYNDLFKIEVYKIDYARSDSIPLIKNEQENVLLEKFWNSGVGIRKDVLDWHIEQLIKYDSVDSLIESLYISIKEKLIGDKILFNYFKNIINMKPIKKINIKYMLEKILEHFENVFKNQDNIIIELARIELRYYSFLEDKRLYSLRLMLSKNASMYAELCSYVYKADDGFRKDISNENFSFYFNIYFNLKFKVGINNNNVCEKGLVEKWVSDFKEALDEYNIGRLYNNLLGKVIGFNIILQGFNDPIVNIIEENGSDKLIRAISIECYNSYGVRWVSDGREWLNKKKKYSELYNKLNGKVWTKKLLELIIKNCDEMYFVERDLMQGNI